MVQLCEKANETYAVKNVNMPWVLAIEGRRVVGVGGQVIDRLFTRFDRRRYVHLNQNFIFLILVRNFFIFLNG